MIVLFLQFYVPQNKQRALELAKCLQNNIDNRHIDELRVYFEKNEDMHLVPDSPRIIKRLLQKRMTYGFWLEETNKLPVGAISILINADIYLTESITALNIEHEYLLKDQIFVALTRHNPTRDEDGNPTSTFTLNSDPHWTQDLWAIVNPSESFPPALIQEASFEMGHPGCDNKIAYVMHSYGYKVINPCIPIQAIHLQQDAVRSYDRKESKLLGLHLLVFPVDSLSSESKLEFQLLTRNSHDFDEIKVNNWINGRKSQFLLPQAGDLSENKLYKKINLSEINLNKLTSVFSYTDDMHVLQDESFLYFYDKNWPTVNVIHRSVFNQQEVTKDNFTLFANGFLPFVLTQIDIHTQKNNEHDIYFWQYPCRTEQSAYESHLNRFPRKPNIQNEIVHVYIPIPWATLIDKNIFSEELLNNYHLRIKFANDFASTHGLKLKVHTVCQHIRWRELQTHLEKIGITDFWISHKEKGVDTLGDIQLHPWSLFAVNFIDPSRSAGLQFKAIEDKPLLASFIGAHMPNYISDVRPKLEKLTRPSNVIIELTDMWHFEDFVYKYLRKGLLNFKHSLTQSQPQKYNETLSDSVFSLCPSGSGPNSLRLWESFAVGAIPVILSDKLELPQISAHAPSCNVDIHNAVIFHSEDDLETLFERLKAMSSDDIKVMQKNGMEVYAALKNMVVY